MKYIRHDSPAHENAAGELIRELNERVTAQFKGRPMGIGLFVFDMGEGGYMGWASNCLREDMAASLVEWLGTQEPKILAQAVERWKAQQLLGAGAERVQ